MCTSIKINYMRTRVTQSWARKINWKIKQEYCRAKGNAWTTNAWKQVTKVAMKLHSLLELLRNRCSRKKLLWLQASPQSSSAACTALSSMSCSCIQQRQQSARYCCQADAECNSSNNNGGGGESATTIRITRDPDTSHPTMNNVLQTNFCPRNNQSIGQSRLTMSTYR